MREMKWRLIKHPYWAMRYALTFYRMNGLWAAWGGFAFGWKFAAKIHAYCKSIPNEF